ncbi:hypothetical protein [Secundilactobacillus paracollinoides]|uniref:hypothetical protein n=1 Tax=Secundilactobacillus paracollinoides TaxID=240427 RepID=UPI0006EF0479|nr:hypothetical protein [Secundilactobacillus paracollinoides]KRL76077.1 hypothetical protein FC17_GL002128 [Secundilactobacillus paracollinoides DSM 15502 = JCM 11969]
MTFSQRSTDNNWSIKGYDTLHFNWSIFETAFITNSRRKPTILTSYQNECHHFARDSVFSSLSALKTIAATFIDGHQESPL